MNSNKILVDTCIWVDFFRTKSKSSNHMKTLILKNKIVTTGIVIAELLQGVKTDKERDVIIDIFDNINYLETDKKTWIESGILGKKLRKKGKTVPLSDILIAQCAIKHNYAIFTIDKHFKEIPDLHLYNA